MPDDGAAIHDEAKLRLKPTIIIGLGGTGKEVLLRIRRSFYERNGRNPDGSIGYPIIGYLLLDTNDQDLDKLQGEALSPFVAQNIALGLSGGIPQFIHCKVDGESFNAYFREGNEHPHVARWLLPEFNRFGAVAIVDGAGQNRPFGRLAFFHNYKGTHQRPGIRDTLTARIHEILDRAGLPDLVQEWAKAGIQVEPNHLDVILVYSLAGGTGAGMFLDMGMLARQVVKELAGDQLVPHFTHIAMLPEAFINDTHQSKGGTPIQQEELKRKIQANAFAALREMEYFAMRRGPAFDLTIPPPVPADGAAAAGLEPLYHARWSEAEKKPFPVDDCPWDVCYLVGAGNDMMGSGYLHSTEMFQMISEYIFLDFDPSQFGSEKRSLRSNQLQVETSSFDDPVKDPATGRVLYNRPLSRRFRIFGLSQIYFDRTRMRRAASYRLARRLISEHWLRPSALAAGDLEALPRQDLLGGVDKKAEVVTLTALPDDRPMRLSVAAVRDRVMRRTAEGMDTWFDLLAREAGLVRKQIAEGLTSYSDGKPIEDFVDQNKEPLVDSLISAGTSGSALRSFATEQEKLSDDVEKRLRCLFLYRLGQYGIPATRQLLKEYAALIQKEAAESRKIVAKAPGLPSPRWQDRLSEARHLPVRRYATRATREEALRAVDQMHQHLKARYLYSAGPYLCATFDRLHGSVTDRPAEPGQPASWARALERFETAQVRGGVLAYLESRFKEHAGRSGMKEGRTVGLFSDYSEEDYDKLILESPGIKLLNKKKPMGGDMMNWPGVEQAVLAELRRLRPDRWGDATSLGKVVEQFTPLNKEDPPTAHQVADFARDLAEACEFLLAGFVADTTALDRFYADKGDKEDARLNLLRTYSAPYLRRAGSLKAALADAHLDAYLGISSKGESDPARFVEGVTNPRQFNPQQAILSNAKRLEMKDDALVLYQEKVGVPLCYYHGLEALGRIYDAFDRPKETHFDYDWMSSRMPEIRMVDSAKQRVLAETLKNTLYGIMIRKVRHDGRDYLIIRQQGGPITHAVSDRLDKLVLFFASPDNDADRDRLGERVTQWFDEATRGDGAALAALWCALQRLHAVVSQRVQHLIRTGQVPPEVARTPHPIASILYDTMLKKTRELLRDHPEGARYLNSRLDWDPIARDEEMSPTEKARLFREWCRVVDGCFEETFVEGVIPVLRVDARPDPESFTANGHPGHGHDRVTGGLRL